MFQVITMASEMQNLNVLHPRPSSIVAALYTLRDLGAEVVILHGPSGCCFKHARLLEEDGVRVLTTALDEAGFVFGGHSPLTALLKKAMELFHPRLIGLTGSLSDVARAADAYRVFYKRVKTGDKPDDYTLDHTAFIYLVDRDGKYLGFFPPGTDAPRLVEMIRPHLKGGPER